MPTQHGDRNEDRFRRDQSWSPYERDERGERERERDRERGGWGMMDAARGDRGEIDDRYRSRQGWRDDDYRESERGRFMGRNEFDSGRFSQGSGDRYGGYGYGFDRFGGGGGYAGERWEGRGEYGQDRYGRGDQERYRGDGGQSGAMSGSTRGRHQERTGYGYGGSEPQFGGRTGGGFRGKGPAGYQRSDERIREDISDMLTDDDDIDASGIEVQVKNGEVTLTGHVPDRRTKRMAEDLVERATGVKDVTNNLRVQRDDQHAGNGGGRQAQSVSSSTDKDTEASHRRPRA